MGDENALKFPDFYLFQEGTWKKVVCPLTELEIDVSNVKNGFARNLISLYFNPRLHLYRRLKKLKLRRLKTRRRIGSLAQEILVKGEYK